MTMRPLVTVIVIFLNEERFLSQAVDSVMDQSFENWELLLVDDGSSDGSTTIARDCALDPDRRITYLEHAGHENRGMSASRNLGLHEAQGQYVTFLDADDIFTPNKLADQVRLMEASPDAAFVCGRSEWWYSWSDKENPTADFLQYLHLPLNAVASPPAILTAFLRDEWASLCDVLVRTEIALELGGYEERFRGMYEDQAFHVKLCLAHRGYVAEDCWYRYRQHPDACTATSLQTGSTSDARRDFLEWCESYLRDQGVPRRSAWRAVQFELMPYRRPRVHWLLERCRGLLGLARRLRAAAVTAATRFRVAEPSADRS
jgi:glycosyltransferase involved in cell wall biosynthesis